jgi:hypothetical protein
VKARVRASPSPKPSKIKTCLFLFPFRAQRPHHLSGRFQVFAKGLFNDDPVDALVGVAVLLQPAGDRLKDRGGQSHVEDAIAVLRLGTFESFAFELLELLGQVLKCVVFVIGSRQIRIDLEEFVNL